MPIRTTREKRLVESSNIYLSEENMITIPEEWNSDTYKDEFYNPLEELEELKEVIGVRPSEFVQFAMRLVDKDGDSQSFKPFSFNERNYWIPIYDTESKRILMKTGRQCEKSTFTGNRMLTYCCINVGFHALYVCPTQIQLKTFRNDRIKGAIDTSDILKVWFNSKLQESMLFQEFVNHSKITMRYAFLSADRVRGVSGVDCLVIDEFQDIILDNVSVIEQTAFAGSKQFRIFMYTGTPKSLDNPIEKYWSEASTQNEWAIPCDNHTYSSRSGMVRQHWNVITDDKNIESKGLACEVKTCRKLINPRDPRCHWVSMNPSVFNNPAIKHPYEGYHIPQLISPRCDWDQVLQNYHFNPRQKFFNEELGVSYDSGDKPLTRQDLAENCAEDIPLVSRLSDADQIEWQNAYLQDRPIYAGIDWTGGSERSYTVLNLASYLQDQGHWFYVPFYWRRFDGPDSDPRIQIEKIIQIIIRWKARFVGCDYGGGFWPNDELTRKFGASRIWKYQYANPKIKCKWEAGLKRFIMHRSEIMSDVFNAIKRKDIFRFPRMSEFEKPFGEDFLSITSEYNEQRNTIMYQKNLNGTDDSFHSLVTGFLGSFHHHPRHDIINFSSLTSFSDM